MFNIWWLSNASFVARKYYIASDEFFLSERNPWTFMSRLCWYVKSIKHWTIRRELAIVFSGLYNTLSMVHVLRTSLIQLNESSFLSSCCCCDLLVYYNCGLFSSFVPGGWDPWEPEDQGWVWVSHSFLFLPVLRHGCTTNTGNQWGLSHIGLTTDYFFYLLIWWLLSLLLELTYLNILLCPAVRNQKIDFAVVKYQASNYWHSRNL